MVDLALVNVSDNELMVLLLKSTNTMQKFRKDRLMADMKLVIYGKTGIIKLRMMEQRAMQAFCFFRHKRLLGQETS